jgi:hypothetical protein
MKEIKSLMSSNIKNPLKRGDNSKLKTHHEKNMNAAGNKGLKSPLK